jgi:hypothetical protein
LTAFAEFATGPVIVRVLDVVYRTSAQLPIEATNLAIQDRTLNSEMFTDPGGKFGKAVEYVSVPLK